MINIEDFKKVTELLEKKKKIEPVLQGFNSNIITSKIHRCLPAVEKELNKRALVLIQAELDHIDAELSKYISSEG